MAKIIAILNFKGGVGKTTTTVNLGDALHLLGKKVLIVDIDGQRNSTLILDSKNEVEETLFDAIAPKKIQNVAIYEHSKGLDFIAGDKRLKNIDEAFIGRVSRETILKKVLLPAQNLYDYILIDCPPNAGILTMNAMTAANSLIIPIDSQVMALDGMSDITELYDDVKSELNPELDIEGFLLTRYRSNLNSSKTVYNALRDNFGKKVFNAKIRENTTVSQAPGARNTIFEYDKTCSGAEDYMQLAREIAKTKKKITK